MTVPPAGPDQAAQAAEVERQRLVAVRKAARESGVMMQMSGANRSVEVPAAETTPAVPATVERAPDPKLALDPDRDPNGQQRKADFLAEKREADDINPHTPVAHRSEERRVGKECVSPCRYRGAP